MSEQVLYAKKSENLTISTIAVALTSATYGAARRARIVTSDGAIRATVSGTSPTSTTGRPIPAGSEFELENVWEVQNFKAIRDTDATADGKIYAEYDVPS